MALCKQQRVSGGVRVSPRSSGQRRRPWKPLSDPCCPLRSMEATVLRTCQVWEPGQWVAPCSSQIMPRAAVPGAASPEDPQQQWGLSGSCVWSPHYHPEGQTHLTHKATVWQLLPLPLFFTC